MSQLISKISALFPASWNVPDLLILGLLAACAILLLGWLFRIFLGKESDFNHALSTAVAIVFLYGLCAIAYPLLPGELTGYFSSLPFARFSNHAVTFFTFSGTPFPTICHELLSLIVLSFLVHLLNLWIPSGKHIISWYLLRFSSVALAVLLHSFLLRCFSALVPGTLADAAPMILMIILGVLLLLCVVKLLLGVVLTIASPILGAIYTFFFSHKIGKQLSKAVLTTMILSGMLWILEILGYTTLSIASTSSPAYAVLSLSVLVLWYLTGHIF